MAGNFVRYATDPLTAADLPVDGHMLLALWGKPMGSRKPMERKPKGSCLEGLLPKSRPKIERCAAGAV
jgi:hypothetical protein